MTHGGCAGLIRGLHAVRPSLAQVAQLVEQWIENPRVGGSIPPLGTMIKNLTHLVGLFAYRALILVLDPAPPLTRPIEIFTPNVEGT